MFRSEPIPTIQNAQQMTVCKMAICYSYSADGISSNQAVISFYGVDKGGRNLIATATLDTDVSYTANGYASCVIVGIPVEEYPYVYWEMTTPATSKFSAIHGQPQLLLYATGGIDYVDASIIKQAVRA